MAQTAWRPFRSGGPTIADQSTSCGSGVRKKTVKAGDKVVWTVSDGSHTVTSGQDGVADKLFNSGEMFAGDTFDFTVEEKGPRGRSSAASRRVS